MTRKPIVNTHTTRRTSLLLTLRDFSDLGVSPTMAELVREDDASRKVPDGTRASRRGMINEMAHAGLIMKIHTGLGKPTQLSITRTGRDALEELYKDA